MSVFLIIPAFNEEKRIKNTLNSYISFFRKKRISYEILVVSNASSDRTDEIVKKFKKKKVFLLSLKEKGKGLAVYEGFKKAIKSNKKYIGFVDADMATPPYSFEILLNKIPFYDCVFADRSLPDSKIFSSSFFRRKLLNKIFNFFVKLFFGLNFSDTQCGAKLFKKEVIKKIISHLHCKGYIFDVELLFLLNKFNFKIKNLTTIWFDRKGSKINIFSDSFKMF
ncbi:MAG: glycosyltransferase, partial [Candidatus Pacearchaeota archaeon]